MSDLGSKTSAGRAAWWLPRLERCSTDGSRCEYLAWLVVLPDRTAVTGRLGSTAREITLWPNVDAALTAFSPGAVVDEAPGRRLPTAQAAVPEKQGGT